MKRIYSCFLTAAAVAVLFACAEEGPPSVAEQNAIYAAAITQGGEADIEGVPDDSAAPGEGDAAPGAGETDVHRDCSLDAVRARVRGNADTNGDGVISDEERAALERPFGRHGPRGHCAGEAGPAHHDMSSAPPPAGQPGHGGTTSRPPRAEDRDGRRRCGPDGEHGPRGPMPFRRLVWIYDADDSGDLDAAERATLEADLDARGVNLEARLAAFDVDADGALSEAELQAARDAHRARMEAQRAGDLAVYDADGDGRLNQQEMRARHEAKRAARVSQFDVDGSGGLDATEKAALRAFLRTIVRAEGRTP